MSNRLTLPYPPSTNRMYRIQRGYMVKSDDAKAYVMQVRVIANSEHVTTLTGGVILYVDVYRPRKAGDLDNRLKVALDCLQGIFYENDEQIVEIHARRFDDPKNPRLEVEAKAA